MVWFQEGIDNCAAAFSALKIIIQINMKAILLLLRTSELVLVLFTPHSFLLRNLLSEETHESH